METTSWEFQYTTKRGGYRSLVMYRNCSVLYVSLLRIDYPIQYFYKYLCQIRNINFKHIQNGLFEKPDP